MERRSHWFSESDYEALTTYKAKIAHIDTCIDLEDTINARNVRPIHIVCEHSTFKIISHIVGKGVDLECATLDGWRPIHYVCCYSTPDAIRLLIERGVDLESATNAGWRPIHYVCGRKSTEAIQLLIDQGVDLECESRFMDRPIHVVCEHSTPEAIRLIVEQGVDLECETNVSWRHIHLVCQYSTFEIIMYMLTEKHVALIATRLDMKITTFELLECNPNITAEHTKIIKRYRDRIYRRAISKIRYEESPDGSPEGSP